MLHRGTSVTPRSSRRLRPYLMEWVVQEKTRDSYKKAVRGYLQWVVDNDDITTDLEGFDDSLLDYIQELHACHRCPRCN